MIGLYSFISLGVVQGQTHKHTNRCCSFINIDWSEHEINYLKKLTQIKTKEYIKEQSDM